MKTIILIIAFAILCLGLFPALAGTGDEVQTFMKTLELGNAIYYRNLTIIPIYAKEIKDKTDYVTLDNAVKNGYITITELNSGSVPQVKVRNISENYIYLMCGEILTGCKQNRLVGEDVLLMPNGKEIIVPVYCVEQGRWSFDTDRFQTEKTAVEPDIRKMAYERQSQGEIWRGVSKSLCAMNVESRTSSYQDMYKSREFETRSKEYIERFENIPEFTKDAVGVAVGIGDEIVAIDIFCNNNLFNNLWPKLLKSYIANALYREGEKAGITPQDVKELLKIVNRANFNYEEGLDLGETIKAKLPELTTGGLVYRGSVIHLSILPSGEEKKIRDETRIPVIE